jgi:hypothetical protein
MNDTHTTTPGPEFWERVNTVINLANTQCDKALPNEVGASAMFAAARFNAYILARTTASAENMAIEKERALEYFVDQFRNMMASNLDDFAENFDRYMHPDKQ